MEKGEDTSSNVVKNTDGVSYASVEPVLSGLSDHTVEKVTEFRNNKAENEADVVVPLESIRDISEQFVNTVVLSYLVQWYYEVTLPDISPLQPILEVLQIGIQSQVMVAPTIPVAVDSSEGNFEDTIDIDVDVIHPVPVASVVFPTVTVEELTALRNRVDIVEVVNASLHAMIRTMEAVETITRNHERLARIEIERQLASVQESHHQDREDFRKLKDFMTSQYRYRS
ncbi:hypothetical protein Tco_0238365 [Tanacetum coccineum]